MNDIEDDHKSEPTRSDYITVRVAFIALTCVFLVTLIGFLGLLKETHDLAVNTKKSSIVACQRNIEGVRQIFKPFFPSPPQNVEQRKIIAKFNKRVNYLKTECKKQSNK